MAKKPSSKALWWGPHDAAYYPINVLFARIEFRYTESKWYVHTNDFTCTGIMCDSHGHAVQIIEGLFALEH